MNLLGIYRMKKLWLALFIACLLVIILLSVIPLSREAASGGESLIRLDYLQHFLAYFSFGSLYLLWRSNGRFRINRVELGLISLAITGFSVLTELVQIYIPGRAFNPLDVMYNLSGVLFSLLFVYFYIIRTVLRKKHIQSNRPVTFLNQIQNIQL